jgi:hypothetical protein
MGMPVREKSYQICIEEIDITVTKKRMKNVYLKIKREDGTVAISAPHQMSEAEIKRFAEERIDWIRKYQQKYKETGKTQEKLPKPDAQELEYRKRMLKEEVERLVAKWEPVMDVKVSGITIRQMKTRWGSCNVKTHHININLALWDKPKACLEYVVVHEMTHILEPSHNAVFWSYMTRFYPDWKQVRSYLREQVVV